MADTPMERHRGAAVCRKSCHRPIATVAGTANPPRVLAVACNDFRLQLISIEIALVLERGVFFEITRVHQVDKPPVFVDHRHDGIVVGLLLEPSRVCRDDGGGRRVWGRSSWFRALRALPPGRCQRSGWRRELITPHRWRAPPPLAVLYPVLLRAWKSRYNKTVDFGYGSRLCFNGVTSAVASIAPIAGGVKGIRREPTPVRFDRIVVCQARRSVDQAGGGGRSIGACCAD